MKKNKRWKQIQETIENKSEVADAELEYLPTSDAGLFFIGHSIVSGFSMKYRPYMTYLWLRWVNKPEQVEVKERFIKSGDLDRTGEPLFQNKFDHDQAVNVGMVETNGNIRLETQPITK